MKEFSVTYITYNEVKECFSTLRPLFWKDLFPFFTPHKTTQLLQGHDAKKFRVQQNNMTSKRKFSGRSSSESCSLTLTLSRLTPLSICCLKVVFATFLLVYF